MSLSEWIVFLKSRIVAVDPTFLAKRLKTSFFFSVRFDHSPPVSHFHIWIHFLQGNVFFNKHKVICARKLTDKEINSHFVTTSSVEWSERYATILSLTQGKEEIRIFARWLTVGYSRAFFLKEYRDDWTDFQHEEENEFWSSPPAERRFCLKSSQILWKPRVGSIDSKGKDLLVLLVSIVEFDRRNLVELCRVLWSNVEHLRWAFHWKTEFSPIGRAKSDLFRSNCSTWNVEKRQSEILLFFLLSSNKLFSLFVDGRRSVFFFDFEDRRGLKTKENIFLFVRVRIDEKRKVVRTVNLGRSAWIFCCSKRSSNSDKRFLYCKS